ncbi:hypothetical protein [Proteiniphilum sp. X52]|uniref:hypothetical protein n=1 Tax=Proteiniphilum sp. X52 TaxID=2382159 RepID=UPI000F09B3D3|nr:hypothetical protein [Proteiniphilum sp. X52]RNC66810.1 hypothetical protein D7D25_00645 [Proteiniphilum sp. X52]
MKNIIAITAYLSVICAIITVISCDDSDKWKSGPQPAADNPGVYFDKDIPKVIELEANQQGVLIQEFVAIKLGRDESKAGPALRVPVRIRHADPNLTVAETAVFEAGSATAELTIHVGKFEFKEQYAFSIEIDENYSNPYKVYGNDEKGGSTRLDAKIEVVSLVGEATFTPTDYSGSRKPEFTPFKHNIYDNRDGSYTIKNFLYNNSGYDLTFSIDEENNIRPSISNGYHDTDENRWYFYSENSSASSARIPCYIPGANPDDYVTYIYFYTADNPSSYTAFWLDLSTKTGRMMGYSRYSISSSGRIAFNISWE